MSPLTLLWVASVIGAGLFFVSGYLSSQVLARVQAAPPEVDLVSRLALTQPPLAAPGVEHSRAQKLLRLEITQADSVAQDARREAADLRRQLDVELATKAEIDRELLLATSRVAELHRKLTDAQRSLAALPAIQKKLQDLERVHSQKTRAGDTWERRTRELEHELREAKHTVDHLQAQLETQVKGTHLALTDDVKRLNEEQQERTLRVKMLTHRVAELETYAEQNAALRGERDALLQELEVVRSARAEALAPPVPPVPRRADFDRVGMATLSRPSESGTRRKESEGTLESSLKQHLTGLMTVEPGLVVVLSDDNGFPVAGVGSDQEQEGVSVLTSLAQQLAVRAKEFVDLERIERMELADVSGRALRVRFFDWEAQPLALGCLGKRSLVPNQHEELVVTTFPQILQSAWSA